MNKDKITDNLIKVLGKSDIVLSEKQVYEKTGFKKEEVPSFMVRKVLQEDERIDWVRNLYLLHFPSGEIVTWGAGLDYQLFALKDKIKEAKINLYVQLAEKWVKKEEKTLNDYFDKLNGKKPLPKVDELLERLPQKDSVIDKVLEDEVVRKLNNVARIFLNRDTRFENVKMDLEKVKKDTHKYEDID